MPKDSGEQEEVDGWGPLQCASLDLAEVLHPPGAVSLGGDWSGLDKPEVSPGFASLNLRTLPLTLLV